MFAQMFIDDNREETRGTLSVAQKCFQILCWLKCSDENDGVDWNLELHCFTRIDSWGRVKASFQLAASLFTCDPPQIRAKSPESPNGPIFNTLYTNESRLKDPGTQKSLTFGGKVYR